MNAFYEHHKDSIKFRYGCFDHILLNGCVSPSWMEPERRDSSGSNRKTYPVSRKVLRDVADEYHNWVASSARKWGIVDLPEAAGTSLCGPKAPKTIV